MKNASRLLLVKGTQLVHNRSIINCCLTRVLFKRDSTTMISASLILLVILFIVYSIKTVAKPKNYPPGPKWYPFIGCTGIVQKMTNIYGSQWKGLSQLAKDYSTEVLGLKLGKELVVVIYGEKNLRQVFTGVEFEGRPDNFFIRLRCLGKRLGITFTDGPLWREHRHFTVKQLKNVGFGKTAMEKEIQIELTSIINRIKEMGNPISPKKLLPVAVMNVLWTFVAGERINEERLNLLLDLLNARSKAFSMAGGWLNQIPWSRFVFPKLSGYSLIAKINQQISDIIEEAIQKHKNKKIVGNDFIYAFLEEMQENKSSFTEEQLKTICLDLLIAGSQTTSNVLEFALLTILRNRTIQEKIHDEIYHVIGDNTPCWTDNYRLTYTAAFLLEVQRYYTIVPLAGPRRVLDKTSIGNYTIPKNSTVLLSVGDVHFDPVLWDEPEIFKPERFIDETGTLKNVEHLYPFGLGRRRCPGDALARSFIFIIFVGLAQKFRIDCSNGVLPSDEPIIGLISAPRPYLADFILRT